MAGRCVCRRGQFVNEGVVLAEGGSGSGGSIHIAGARVGLGGRVSATGASGGEVLVDAEGLLSLGERVEARGTDGAGGDVRYTAGRVVETVGALTDVSGRTDGGRIVVEAGSLASSGEYRATGAERWGGYIDLGASDLRLLSASLDASGHRRGGLVRVGGAFRGGEAPGPGAAWYGSMAGRWGELPAVVSARETFVNDGTAVDVSSAQGPGGTLVVWSDERTTFLGSVDARGPTGGGAVALSSAGEVRHASLSGVVTGAGHLLVEGETVTVGNAQAAEAWSYAGVLGVAQARTRATARTGANPADADVTSLEAGDRFGTAVSLNEGGTRLAVGAPYDDGPGQSTANAGAVYLFTFTDGSFSGGRLAAMVGRGYTGGRNVDVAALGGWDRFGSAVSLNGAGNRLAVGAPGDDGAGNGTGNAGAVYLFTFADTQFSGGRLAATLGKGHAGGREVDVAALEGADLFGRSVSLSRAGTRLAVGAPGDDGAGNRTRDAGAVYLFTFADTQFSGGRLVGIAGRGYTGGRNVDVAATGSGDQFGASVSLNAGGSRLAVGAPGDDGAGNGTGNAGAVYLFTFANAAFSSGRLAGTAGKGYAGGRNIDVAELGWGDRFGTAVSLSGSGTRLAVGAVGDDGADNRMRDAGAVYLFTFANTAFSSGRLAGTGGRGYTGGRNIDVAELGWGDRFGTAVSLSGSGTRLAVGAVGDDGADNRMRDAGAVYLFTFANTAFSSGRLAGTAGKGFTGGWNVDVGSLETGDGFGTAVSLNGSGNRLAVGAPHDDGAGNETPASGAVYLFTFTDTAFSGGRLAAIVGKGYTGGRNIDVASLEVEDRFRYGGVAERVGHPPRDRSPARRWPRQHGVRRRRGVSVHFHRLRCSRAVASPLSRGKGYSGGRNIDVTPLEGGVQVWTGTYYDGREGDRFGASGVAQCGG